MFAALFSMRLSLRGGPDSVERAVKRVRGECVRATRGRRRRRRRRAPADPPFPFFSAPSRSLSAPPALQFLPREIALAPLLASSRERARAAPRAPLLLSLSRTPPTRARYRRVLYTFICAVQTFVVALGLLGFAKFSPATGAMMAACSCAAALSPSSRPGARARRGWS